MTETALWSLGIITAPRTTPTLEQCIAGLHRAGFQPPHVFAEPGSPRPAIEEPYHWHQRAVRFGAWPNWFTGLAQLAQLDPQASHYLMLEDDALLFDAGGAMQRYLGDSLPQAADTGFCSLYCAEAFCPSTEGWIRCNLGYWFIGALALVFSRAAVERVIAAPDLINHRRRRGPDEGMRLTDAVLGRWALQNDLHVYVHHPSLVEHVGLDSTVGNADQPPHLRRARNYIGGTSNSVVKWRKKMALDT